MLTFDPHVKTDRGKFSKDRGLKAKQRRLTVCVIDVALEPTYRPFEEGDIMLLSNIIKLLYKKDRIKNVVYRLANFRPMARRLPIGRYEGPCHPFVVKVSGACTAGVSPIDDLFGEEFVNKPEVIRLVDIISNDITIRSS